MCCIVDQCRAQLIGGGWVVTPYPHPLLGVVEPPLSHLFITGMPHFVAVGSLPHTFVPSLFCAIFILRCLYRTPYTHRTPRRVAVYPRVTFTAWLLPHHCRFYPRSCYHHRVGHTCCLPVPTTSGCTHYTLYAARTIPPQRPSPYL